MAIIGTVQAKDITNLNAQDQLDKLPWRVIEKDTGTEYRFKTRREARAFRAGARNWTTTKVQYR